MRCAIYARRSTEEHQAASLEVQVEEARRWIAARGWSVVEEHVHVDSGVSGAEFKRRPGLIALLNAADDKAFDVVVMRDESRLGRDTHRAGLAIQGLAESGVQLWLYFSGERVSTDDATSRFMLAVKAFASELEREKLAGRTREHLRTKAERGLVTGGRVYGYDNVAVLEGERRVCVEHRINEREAAIVRELFERYAAGDGLRTIVCDLNERGVPPPRASIRASTRRDDGGGSVASSWCVGTVRPMLERERYRGVLVWGRRAKGYKGGTKIRSARPEAEWIRTEREDLRIVPEPLWQAVAERFARQATFSRNCGGGPPTTYLLTGLARCATCGGPIQVSHSRLAKETIRVYCCGWYHSRGHAVCANGTRRPVKLVDATILDFVRACLSDDLARDVVAGVREALIARTQPRPLDPATVLSLESEAAGVRKEIRRLTEALAASDEPPAALVQALQERERRLRGIVGQLDAARPEAVKGPSARELDALEAEARRRIAGFREALERNPAEAKAVLRVLLEAPLRVSRVGGPKRREGRFQFEGALMTGKLLAGEGGTGLAHVQDSRRPQRDHTYLVHDSGPVLPGATVPVRWVA